MKKARTPQKPKDRNYVAKNMPLTGGGKHEAKRGEKASRARQKHQWKKDLRETRIVTNYALTVAQKTVLTKTISAPTPKVAGESISSDRKSVTARDMLVKFDLLEYNEDGTAEVTEKGKGVMKEENLVDEAGELTPEGQKYAYPPDEEPPAPEEPPEAEPEGGAGLDQGEEAEADPFAEAVMGSKIGWLKGANLAPWQKKALEDNKKKKKKSLLKEINDLANG